MLLCHPDGVWDGLNNPISTILSPLRGWLTPIKRLLNSHKIDKYFVKIKIIFIFAPN
jgi:hypothetical protein